MTSVPTLEDLPPVDGKRVLLRADFNVPVRDGEIADWARKKGAGLASAELLPGARVYSGPLTFNANARVAARARNLDHWNLTGPDNPPLSTPWSGVTAASFVVQTPPLVITELMYHPQPPPAGNTNDADNFEYIEFKNRGTSALNLVGFRFTNGVDFTFSTASSVTSLPPGGRALVVRDRAAFSSRYPTATNNAGEYAGRVLHLRALPEAEADVALERGESSDEAVVLVVRHAPLDGLFDFRATRMYGFAEMSQDRLGKGLGFCDVSVDSRVSGLHVLQSLHVLH